MEHSVIALLIIACVIILYVKNVIPYATTSILACIAMVLFKVIPFNVAFSGFSSNIVMLVAGVMLIGNALFESGAAGMMGQALSKICGNNEKLFLLVCILFTVVFSAFTSNTATVAMLLPIVATVAEKSGGIITKKNTYMGIGFASVAGGGLTLIGSTPQLVAQGMLHSAGLRELGFFELSLIGIPRVILLIFYFMTFGYYLQKKVFTFREMPTVHLKTEGLPDHYNTTKAIISIAIVLLCAVGFILQILPLGIIALLGGGACILTGCISEKKAFQTMDWNTIIILAGAIGFASGLDKSGGGELIANFIIGLLGNNLSYFALLCLFTVIATVMSNIMSHTATASVLLPIALVLSKALGYDATFVAIAIVMGCNMAYTTPIATPPLTMTLVGGYRFNDYVKIGGILNLLSLFVTFITYIILI